MIDGVKCTECTYNYAFLYINFCCPGNLLSCKPLFPVVYDRFVCRGTGIRAGQDGERAAP